MSDALLECAGVSAEQLQQLLGLVDASDIEELDITLGATRLSVRRTATTAAIPSEQVALESAALAITSPLVGIFHPAIEVGATVAPGQPIGAVEALGMPTSVEAPRSGMVEGLLVEDGAAVEYGQPLVILRVVPKGA